MSFDATFDKDVELVEDNNNPPSIDIYSQIVGATHVDADSAKDVNDGTHRRNGDTGMVMKKDKDNHDNQRTGNQNSGKKETCQDTGRKQYNKKWTKQRKAK